MIVLVKPIIVLMNLIELVLYIYIEIMMFDMVCVIKNKIYRCEGGGIVWNPPPVYAKGEDPRTLPKGTTRFLSKILGRIFDRNLVTLPKRTESCDNRVV